MVEIDEQELKELREDAANGVDWFSGYMDIDDFLFEELGEKFPTDSANQVENTIAAIKAYAEQEKFKLVDDR